MVLFGSSRVRFERLLQESQLKSQEEQGSTRRIRRGRRAATVLRGGFLRNEVNCSRGPTNSNGGLNFPSVPLCQPAACNLIIVVSGKLNSLQG